MSWKFGNWFKSHDGNFMLGPAFNLRIRVLGMGGWTISHVCAAFTEFSGIGKVKVVNYSSSQWVVPDDYHKAGVSLNKAQEKLLKEAVGQLCDVGQKILVCSAGNYLRDIDQRDALEPYYLIPQLWASTNSRIVVVGATKFDQSESFADDMSNTGPEVAILAPGVQVPVIGREGAIPKFSLNDGTSFSSPFMAGVITQLIGFSMDNSQKAIEIAKATADEVTVPAGKNVTNKRANFWKAVLTAANGHLSSQTGRQAGTVNGYPNLQAKDHGTDTNYYGFQIHTTDAKGSIWLRTGTVGNYTYTALGDGDKLPVAFQPGQPYPAVTYAGINGPPFIPSGAGKWVLCLSVSKQDLKLNEAPVEPTLIVAKNGDDPRATPNLQPVITMAVDANSLQSFRTNVNGKVKGFSDFVYKLEE